MKIWVSIGLFSDDANSLNMLFLSNTRAHLILVVTSVLSCFAFVYTEIFHHFAMVLLIILQFKTQEPKLKLLQALPLVLMNGISFWVLMFSQYLPKRKVSGFAKTDCLFCYSYF
jgi:hypothetical protein